MENPFQYRAIFGATAIPATQPQPPVTQPLGLHPDLLGVGTHRQTAGFPARDQCAARLFAATQTLGGRFENGFGCG